jgi:hypothetical protein
MANVKTTDRVRVVDVVRRLGRCVELVSMDPNFHEITVGLYEKDAIMTVWTFSRKPGVQERIRKIRDQLVALGGLEPVVGTHDQAKLRCGQTHGRPTKFLMRQAVEKSPDYSLPKGRVRDLRSPLMLDVKASEEDGRWVYRVSAEGEAPNEAARLRAVTAGFVRYGEMEKFGDDAVVFQCGYRHDPLARLVLPYARNVGQVEGMLEAEALRGQMTTGTLGFAPPA